jgi:hypothetical protein
MNGALLMGIGAGINAYNTDVQAEKQYQRELQMMQKKAELQAQLEMQIQEAKMAYAKANPQYNKFIQGRFGDVIGFDEFGGSKQLYTAPEDERQSYQDEYDYQRAYKESQARAADARGLLSTVNAELAPQKQDSLEVYRQARLDLQAENADRKEANDFELAPADWEKTIKTYMPPSDSTLPPTEEEYAAMRAAAEERMIADGLSKKPKGSKPSGLAAPATQKPFPAEDKEYMQSVNEKAAKLRSLGVPEEEIDAAVQADIAAEAAKRGYQL